MTWGIGPWGGGSPWGTGIVLPPPSLIAVSSFPGVDASKSLPASVDFRGGTICLAVGTNFFDPITIEVLSSGPGGYVVAGSGYVFDPEFDLKRNAVYFGAPALPFGSYHLRVTTDGGISNVLSDVLYSRHFAEDFKVLSVRGKYAPIWDTGPRLLTNESIGLTIP